MASPKDVSEDQKAKFVEAVDAARAKGLSIPKAVDAVKKKFPAWATKSNYAFWKDRAEGKAYALPKRERPSVSVPSVPRPPTDSANLSTKLAKIKHILESNLNDDVKVETIKPILDA